MDDQGLTTLKGARIEWNQFTKIRRVITKMGSSSNTVAEHYELASTKGKVIVDMYHLMDSEKVIDYIWQHLTEPVKQIQK
jgi:uncharacterized protein (UPF0276 family)